jgi:single-strand DNA-binding protein
MRVIVTGKLRQRSYQTNDGDTRTVYELDCDEVGVSLRTATAKVQKATRPSTGTADPGGHAEPDPRASEPSVGYSHEPPF